MPKREFELENNHETISEIQKRKGGDDARALLRNAPGRELAHDDYTVGWICALAPEYVAAQAFLDEMHEGLEYVSPIDNNDYILGKIGKHNVVIAVSPERKKELSSLAIVATHMLHSFPNITIVLMVVIGGGAPSERHDIRLGDVVVSASRDGNGGVFQHDLGKSIQDHGFQPTGILKQPPMILQSAVYRLEDQYESEGHRLKEVIDSILEKNPRLQQKFKRPDPSNDRLYETRYTHEGGASCGFACDPSNLRARPARTEDEDNPAIHYGLIASGNQLIKDALVRDRLVAEKDVLCLEMGSAGVMNYFPCLVICGICDYSDTHKNLNWQGYAAMAAAAYAKDLLYRIPSVQSKKASVISATSLSRNVSIRASYHDYYSVGWICPLEVEQIAALEMLDEEHERLPQSSSDHNVYNLGSIAGHNVVIVGLHQPGNNPAAIVLTQMRMTFPNLRFGLLVGIGGGVPVKTDNGMIRLGHVVVSKPTGGHSGAVQYDHGKAKDGQFERTSALALPPAVLLNAAQDLAAKQARSRVDPVEENIKRIDTSIPGLRRYKHPGSGQDRLYKRDYMHLKHGVSCDECGCDPSQCIQRAIDDEDEQRVVVHRGTIASGELVVKDAVMRDQLAEEYDVLCFEMEAAGALADFPCIVIRGISDYCDSHKNDQWHGYAAAAAAAYARQLFFHMPIDEVKQLQ